MAASPVKEYDFYLFDADGTLFDTTEMIVRCFRNTARVHNLAVPDREAIIGHVGMTLRKQMEHYFGVLPDDTYNRYRATHMAYQLEIYREHLHLCPGVAQALDCLQKKGKKCAVVTSRMMETLSIYLTETGIINFFDVLITPECTERHKPDPQPAIEALSRLNGVPERALFIGDSSFDVECGSGAGMATAFVAWSHNAAETFNCKPTWIISDMLDLCVW